MEHGAWGSAGQGAWSMAHGTWCSNGTLALVGCWHLALAAGLLLLLAAGSCWWLLAAGGCWWLLVAACTGWWLALPTATKLAATSST
jgi:hypothetical protein